jgi:signal transduction histidine kinase/ligand-binding sensor domain-containing protein
MQFLGGESRQTKRAAFALVTLLAWCPCVFGLNPSLDVTQYAHAAWKVGEALPSGAIRAIAQTPDGYLWLGTEFGLYRFDGVRAAPWLPPVGEHLANMDIRSLCAARDGRLWIGTFNGLASWKDGKLTRYPDLDGQVIEALREDRGGTMWAAGWAPTIGRLCGIQSGKTECYGQDGRFGNGVTPLFEDSRGDLWAGAMTGLWRWNPGPPNLYPVPYPEKRIYALAESDDGGILVAKRSGITKLRNGKTETFPLPSQLPFQPFRLLRDRDGGLWIGDVVDGGLLHIHEGRTDHFQRADGLSSSAITSLLEDREGNIWVATVDGLDRFREFAVPTVSVQQGVSSRGVFSVLAARDGALWLGTSVGIDKWNQGQITSYRTRSLRRAGGPTDSIRTGWEIVDPGVPDYPVECLFQDDGGQIWAAAETGVAVLQSDRFTPVPSVPRGVVYSMSGDRAGNIWIAHQDGVLRLVGRKVVERTPWAKFGHGEPATALRYDAAQDGLWLGFRDGGVALFKEGQIRASYGRPDGLGEGMVRRLSIERDGAIWAATEGGLSRIQDGRVITLTTQNGLPCNAVHWMMEDDSHSVWLYMACGLARMPRSDMDAWVSHPERKIQAAVLDSSDGVSYHRFTGSFDAVVARSMDGKLWFLRVGGVSIVDPRHLSENKIRPPVHIEQITADDKKYDLRPGMRLPANVRNLRIEYTALSLVAPEKTHFKYTLEGQNRNWHEVINERHAVYTNLPPRQYRFRVMATNNSGVWNETGDTLEFSIAPAYYQTPWFYALCVAAFLAMLWGLYRLRLYQIRREFNAQLDGRVDERMRVARELHDTLLQSFQASLIQMQAARNVLTRRPEKAEESLDKAISTAAGAVAEGRDAIQNLRAQPVGEGDLAQLLTAAGQELAHSDEAPENPPVFRLTVEGERRDLEPLLQDEVYRIARELLRNAFRHAQAGRIEAEIRYESRQLRVHVRDDGKGIDPEILQAGGRAGHWGLPGMRERAGRLGGKLDFWSEGGAGTEAVLTVPAAAAYANSNGGAFSFLRRKLWIHER